MAGAVDDQAATREGCSRCRCVLTCFHCQVTEDEKAPIVRFMRIENNNLAALQHPLFGSALQHVETLEIDHCVPQVLGSTDTVLTIVREARRLRTLVGEGSAAHS